jgi:hypothetical protein
MKSIRNCKVGRVAARITKARRAPVATEATEVAECTSCIIVAAVADGAGKDLKAAQWKGCMEVMHKTHAWTGCMKCRGRNRY